MTDAPARTLPSARRRRQVGLGVLRSLAAAIVLVGLYYLLPLDHLASVPLEVTLAAGLLVLVAVAAWQVRLVIRARYPALRAAEALATTLLALGLGIRVFIGAVQLARQAHPDPAGPAASPRQQPQQPG